MLFEIISNGNSSCIDRKIVKKNLFTRRKFGRNDTQNIKFLSSQWYVLKIFYKVFCVVSPRRNVTRCKSERKQSIIEYILRIIVDSKYFMPYLLNITGDILRGISVKKKPAGASLLIFQNCILSSELDLLGGEIHDLIRKKISISSDSRNFS